jgi:hypothetical protein
VAGAFFSRRQVFTCFATTNPSARELTDPVIRETSAVRVLARLTILDACRPGAILGPLPFSTILYLLKGVLYGPKGTFGILCTDGHCHTSYICSHVLERRGQTGPPPYLANRAMRQGNCFGKSGRVNQEGSRCGASGRALMENNDACVTTAR